MESYCSLSGFRHISTVTHTALTKLDNIRKGLVKNILTKWATFNEITSGLQPGDQLVIAARPGVGKSTTINSILDDVYDPSINPDVKVVTLYWSFEMPDYQQVYRLLSKRSGKTVRQLTSPFKPLDDEEFINLSALSEKFANHPIYFRDIPVNTETWGKMIEEAQRKYPDHYILNIVDHTRLISGSDTTEERKITGLMAKGVELKNKIGCINIFLSQLNRDVEKEKKRSDIGKTPPVLSDIFGSDAVSQYATMVIAIHRPEMYGLTTYEVPDVGTQPCANRLFFHVLKQRDGAVGVIVMRHNLAVNLIEDINQELRSGKIMI